MSIARKYDTLFEIYKKRGIPAGNPASLDYSRSVSLTMAKYADDVAR